MRRLRAGEDLPAAEYVLRLASERHATMAVPDQIVTDAQRLQQISRETVHVNFGSLYPALHRLEQKRWLRSEWRQSETGREAKFYALTPAGHKQLAREKASWDKLTDAVRLIFNEGA